MAGKFTLEQTGKNEGRKKYLMTWKLMMTGIREDTTVGRQEDRQAGSQEYVRVSKQAGGCAGR